MKEELETAFGLETCKLKIAFEDFALPASSGDDFATHRTFGSFRSFGCLSSRIVNCQTVLELLLHVPPLDERRNLPIGKLRERV